MGDPELKRGLEQAMCDMKSMDSRSVEERHPAPQALVRATVLETI
jgi:hypothetical protein